MKKAAVPVFLLLAACVAVWLGMREEIVGRDGTSAKSGGASRGGTGESLESVGAHRTKVAIREVSGVKRTHSPERLRDFMLPQIRIEGLPLGSALQKLMEAYQQTCLTAGETALPLTFAIPAGTRRNPNFRLPAQNFTTSVGMLATLSGMRVERRGTNFRFEALAEGHGAIKKTLNVPTYFTNQLADMLHDAPDPVGPFAPPPPRQPIEEILADLGLDLAPDTRISLRANGELEFEGTSATDAAAIDALARLVSEQQSFQMKHDAQLVEIPAGVNVPSPDLQTVDAEEIQGLMWELAHTKGVTVMPLPSVSNRNGQNATIEMIQEVIYPTDAMGTSFETRNVGVVLNVKGTHVGFGEEIDFDYSHNAVDGVDMDSGKPLFKDLAKLSESGYGGDGATRYSVQTHPDGSKTLVLITTELIDATGRPIH